MYDAGINRSGGAASGPPAVFNRGKFMKKKNGAIWISSLLAACLAAGCGEKAGAGDAAPTAEVQSGTENATPSARPDGVTPPASSQNEEDDAAQGEASDPAREGETAGEPTRVPPVTAPDVRYEAEDGKLSGSARVEKGKKGFTGSGYVGGFENEGDACTFVVEVEQEGFYDLEFVTASQGGQKENYVTLDGQMVGTISSVSTDFQTTVMERTYLTAGQHEIAVSKYWGWICVDAMVLSASEELPADLYQVEAKLVNPDASDSAKRLMKYLTDIYGKKILSGQYSDKGMYGLERAAIWRATDGEYPAVLGLDMMEYSPSRAANGSTSKAVEYAIEYWEAGGIVTFAWHWNVPEKYLTDIWWKGFNTESVNIDLAKIMNGEDEEGYELLISDIDVIAGQLKRLQEADVPVLWRPLHEASGGWFWWGAAGADAYKKLYVLLYDRLTNYHGLNNLIWLWNGQSADWYPGDEYVDIIGEDLYPGERVYTSQVKKFLEAAAYSDERKMVVLSENGCLFDPDLAIRDGAMWGFFATWGGEFVLKDASLNFLSEKYTEAEMVKKVYGHDAVINLSELPDLKNYPLP